jgi:hypothetical protein
MLCSLIQTRKLQHPALAGKRNGQRNSAITAHLLIHQVQTEPKIKCTKTPAENKTKTNPRKPAAKIK